MTRLVRELGLQNRVTITGLLPPTGVAAALASASVLVLPNPASAISERYTSPLKLFEYLTMGRPIVASDLASIREVLEHRRTALLVPPGDERALAAALVELRRDPADGSDAGRGCAGPRARFSWEARAGRLETALEAARRS